MPAVEIDVSADHCLRQTCVNDAYVVSTISIHKTRELDSLIEMITDLIGDVGRADLSAPGEYETMVFTGDNEHGVTDWKELDFRRYETEDDAHDGHIEMVTKWLEMPLGLGT